MIKNTIKFILFLIYVIGIFFLQNPILLGIGWMILPFCMARMKLSYFDAIKNLWGFMGVIVFTGVVNSLVVDIYYGGIISIKLMLVCNMTYLFSNSMSQLELAETIANLFRPFRIFKVNPESVKMMIYIALASLPILKQELEQIKFSLKAKGSKTDSFHLLLQAKWVLLPLLTSIFKRINEIEYGLKAKAYESD